MADIVQYRLEQMVDELDDLEKKGIFTRLEINEIVIKRRNFEYKLKRPSPLKQDFLSFIEYEKQLETLRRLRKRVVVRDLEEKGMGNKKIKRSVSDTSCVIRILRVFRLVTMRFKGDVGLWYQYLEFCRQHGHGRMKTVLAQVLRFHPNIPGLWMYAAGWEFDHNLNVASARNLMQRGLRACPNSEDLWVEYLRMELVYLNKLKARKSLLGEDKGLLTRDNKDSDDERWEDENKDLFMALDEGKTNADGSDEESENKLDVFREHASKIIQTVYSGAVEALPSSMNLRKRFLELLGNLDLADSDNLREEILNGMRKDFAKFPEYWDWLSRLQIFDNMKTKKMTMEELRPELDKAVGIYEEALKYVPSAKMLSLYAKFWMDVISAEGDDSQISGSAPSSNFAVEFLSDLLKVYEKAESMGCMTEDLAYQYISLYLRVGRLEEARTMAGRLCDGKLSGAAKLWILRISIEMKWTTSKSSSLAKDDLRSTFELVRNALEKVSVSEADNLWHMVIKFFSNHRAYMDKLVKIFIACIAKDTEGGFSVSFALVNFTLQRDGIQRAREMYKRFLVLPHPSLALHRNCIELESNLAFIGDKDGLVNARKLYESALTTYSQDVGLWRDYYSLENKVGTSETANGVYWRARKTLKDSSRLIDPRDAC